MLDKIIGEAKGVFNIITLIDIVSSLIYVVVGLLFFSNSSGSNVVVSIITGIIFIIGGINCIYSFMKKRNIELFSYNLLIGIILIVLGIVAMFLGKVLSIALGLYFIVSGAQKFSYSFFLKKFNEKTWVFDLFVGILFLILGITTFFTNGDAAISVAGICLLGYGLMNLISTILLRKRSKFFIA